MIFHRIYETLMQMLMRTSFNLPKRLKFYRILAKATDEKRHGVRVKQVLEHLMHLEKRSNKNSMIYKMYKSWVNQLNQGKGLGVIMGKFVPPAEAMIISASETSGKISDGFVLVTEVARVQSQFKKVFKEALIGPLVILTSAFAAINFFCIKIFPSIAASLDVNQMSGVSKFVLGVVDGYVIWFPASIVILIGLVGFITWALPNYKAGFRVKLENIPPFSLYRISVGCSFLHAFNSLTKSGVQQVKALQQMSQFASPYLRYRIDKILYLMNRGMPFGQSLINSRLNFPDKDVIDELSMHAESGSIDAVLSEIVDDLNVDGLELIKLQAAIAKYFCTLITVGLILFLVFGLFSFVKDMQALTMH